MRIVTWNVNSIRARLDHALKWVWEHKPDVLCLQEVKVVADAFPLEEFEEFEYSGEIYGQKTYNGVALLTPGELEDVVFGFDDGDEEDPQARVIRATYEGVRIVNVYCPNGQALDSDKYVYKLAWFERLARMLETQEDASSDLCMLGDFNVAPEPRDTWDPAIWEGKILCSDAERAALAKLMDWGFTDCLRAEHPDVDPLFTWWDYRQGGFRTGRGLRIDHVLATASLRERLQGCFVEQEARQVPKPSDHAPVVVDFED